MINFKVGSKYYTRARPEIVYEVMMVDPSGKMLVRWDSQGDGRISESYTSKESQSHHIENGTWVLKYHPRNPCNLCRSL